MFKLYALPSDEVLASIERRYSTISAANLKACLQMLRLAGDMTDTLDEQLKTFGLTQGRFFILVVMNRTPDTPVSAGQLAEALGVSLPIVTYLLNELESSNLIERSKDREDRRRTNITLTHAGMALLRKVLPLCFEYIATVMDRLTAGELAELTRLLQKLRGPAGVPEGMAPGGNGPQE